MKPTSLALVALVVAGCQSTGASDAQPIDYTSMEPAELEAMMAKYAAPAPEAEVLGGLEGTFDVTTTYWVPRSDEPMTSTGTATGRWIAGGRFLSMEYRGEMMGMPFEGYGWIGYDKVRHAYSSVWIDNMGTWMMDPAVGQLAGDGKTLSFLRDTAAPGGRMVMREVYVFDEDGTYGFDVYMVDDEGNEVKTMHLDAVPRR